MCEIRRPAPYKSTTRLVRMCQTCFWSCLSFSYWAGSVRTPEMNCWDWELDAAGWTLFVATATGGRVHQTRHQSVRLSVRPLLNHLTTSRVNKQPSETKCLSSSFFHLGKAQLQQLCLDQSDSGLAFTVILPFSFILLCFRLFWRFLPSFFGRPLRRRSPWNKGNVYKFGVEQKWVGKMCVFQPISPRISETVRIGPKLPLVTNRKSHKPFKMTWNHRL